MKFALALLTASSVLCAQVAVTTVAGAAGRGSGDSQLYYPGGAAIDAQDNLYIADSYNHRILKITSNGSVTTVLGTGIAGKSDTQLLLPRTLAVDKAGTLYVTDSYNQRVQKLTPDGTVSTIAGSGGQGDALNQLSFPRGVAVDPNGNVFVSDNYNHRVLRVSPEGVTTVFAGGLGPGYEANQLNFPFGLAVDALGTLYIGDAYNHRVQKIPPGGPPSTFFGRFGGGTGMDQLANPVGVDVDAAGNVYVSDTNNNRVQKIAADGTVSTIAGGTGEGPGQFQLSSPFDTAVDSQGNLFVVDTYNHRVQKLTFPAPLNSPQFRHAVTNRPEPGSPNEAMELSPAPLCQAPLNVLVGGYPAEVDGPRFVIPEAVDPNVPTEIYVNCQTRAVVSGMKLPMRAEVPRLYANWAGQALAEVAETGVVIDSQSPAKPGSFVALFGSGFGALDRADALGRRRTLSIVTASIGGLPAEVFYAGTVSGQSPGLVQINLRVPAELKTGKHPVVIDIDGEDTQGGVVLPVQQE